MWLDILVAALVLVLGAFGAYRGALESGIRLAALPFAYGCAIWGGQALAEPVAAATGASAFLGSVLAGTGAFLLAQGLASLAARRARGEATDVGTESRLAGGLFGAARGVLLAIPILWLASLSEGARLAGVSADLPDLSGAQLRTPAGDAVALAAGVLLEERNTGDRVALRIAARPEQALGSMNRLMGDPNLRILQGDGGFWRDVENGDLEGALARPTLRQLENDAQFRQQLGDVGAISELAVQDRRVFRVELHDALLALAPRLRALREDPRVQALLADASLRQQLHSGDTLALIANPSFRTLVSEIAGGTQ